MLKRVIVSLLLAVVTLAAMIGVEIVLAMRREYLPTEPRLEVEGTFVSGGSGDRQLRFIVLGDSTAAGVGASDAAHAYPSLLGERLSGMGYEVRMTSLGISGARVADLVADQLAPAAETDPDLVLIAIGANDVIHLSSIDEVRSGVAEAIERMKATGAIVVVAGAPDMRAAAFYEPLRSLAGWRGRSVSDAIEEAAEDAGVPFVPLARLTYPFFEEAPDTHNSADKFHPGDEGYRRWADAIYPYLERAIEGRAL